MSTRYSTFPARLRERALEADQPAREPIQRNGQASRRFRAQADSVQESGLEAEGHTIGRAKKGNPANRSPVPFDSAGLKARVTARDLMSACAAMLRPEDSIERAAGLMTKTRSGSLPVIDGVGRLIGMITDRDTVKLVAMGASIPHAQVSDCMTRVAFACSADTSLESCVSAMAWHQVKQLPIVDEEHRILGTINRDDLACYICDNPQAMEHGAMADILSALAF